MAVRLIRAVLLALAACLLMPVAVMGAERNYTCSYDDTNYILVDAFQDESSNEISIDGSTVTGGETAVQGGWDEGGGTYETYNIVSSNSTIGKETSSTLCQDNDYTPANIMVSEFDLNVTVPSGSERFWFSVTATIDRSCVGIDANEGNYVYTDDGATNCNDGTWTHDTGVAIVEGPQTWKIKWDTNTEQVTWWKDQVLLANFTRDAEAALAFIQYDSDIPTQLKIDELKMWDYASYGDNCPGYTEIAGGPPPVSGVAVVFTTDEAGTKSTAFSEGENFETFINLTFSGNGSAIPDSDCNLTMNRAIIEEDAAVQNFTLCGAGCNYSNYAENFTGLDAPSDYDFLHFQGCHEEIQQGDISVLMLCGAKNISFDVPASSLPGCASGTALYISDNFSACNASGTINLSFSYPGNNNRRKRIEKLSIYRHYTDHVNFPSEISFNAGTGLYELDHDHELYEHGSVIINASCNNTNSGLDASDDHVITIVNVAPQIFIGQVLQGVNVTELTEAVNLEWFAGAWEWLISVVDDDVDTVTVSFYNGSGNLIDFYSNLSVSTPESIFLDFGNPYNLSVFANDSASAASFESITFGVNDTSAPVCTGFDNGAVQNFTDYTWNVNCQDEFLYSFNLTCSGAEDFQFYTEGLNNQSFSFTNSTLLNSSISCLYRVCDGHTNQKIKSKNVAKNLADDSVIFDDVKIKADKKLKDIKWQKKDDRYTFCMQPDQKETDIGFMIPEGCHAMDTAWPGYIACPQSETWIDFVSVDGLPVETLADRVRVDTSDHDGEWVCFDSIGDFNCIAGEQNITTTPPPPVDYTARVGAEFENTPQALYHIFLLMFWIIIVIVLFTVKGRHGETIQILNVLQMAIGITGGIQFMKFSFMIGFSVIFVSVGLLIGLIMQRK